MSQRSDPAEIQSPKHGHIWVAFILLSIVPSFFLLIIITPTITKHINNKLTPQQTHH